MKSGLRDLYCTAMNSTNADDPFHCGYNLGHRRATGENNLCSKLPMRKGKLDGGTASTRRWIYGGAVGTDGLPDGEIRHDDVGVAHEEDVAEVEVVGGHVDAGELLVAVSVAQRHCGRDEAERVLPDPRVPDDHHLLEGP
jgi:hypothetical protein